MTVVKHTLSKNERLSWKRYVDLLFASGQSFVAFPLRVVFLWTEDELTASTMFMISVPKKKFKHAVDRNRIKRLVRETYRIRKPELMQHLEGRKGTLLIAFLYIDKEERPYKEMEKGMAKAIRLLKEKND